MCNGGQLRIQRHCQMSASAMPGINGVCKLKNILMCSVASMCVAAGAMAQETAPVGANDQRLDTVTVIGLRDVPLDEVTGAVSVLSADDLAIRNSVNPADQLRAVPGVGVSRSGSVGGLTQIRMRGAEANHTLVLFNGIEVSDPTTGETDFGLLSGVGAGQIEVLRGAASSIYGSDAIGGVVSINTADADGRLRGMAEIGTQDTGRGQLSYSHAGQDSEFGVAASAYTTAGVDTSGAGGEKDGSDSYSGLVRGKIAVSTDWDIAGLATYRISSADTDPDLNFDGVLDNADRETDSEQFLLGASVLGATGPVDHVFRASFNSVQREDSADGAETGDTTGERTKLSWSPSLKTGAHTVTGLIDFEQEDYERVGAASFFGDPNQSQTFETLGFGGEYRFSQEAVDLMASVRHDDNDGRFDNTTTWRVGGGYSLDAVNGRVRASVGEGVKNPTFVELFGFFPGSFVGNADLVPERSLGWDIGWDQYIGDFSYSLTYFQADLEDEIFTAFNPDFTSTARNRDGKSERSGFEVGARVDLGAVSLSGQTTYTKSENDGGADEVRVPELTASIGTQWALQNGVILNGAVDYVGEQDDFDFGTFPSTRVTLDSYALVSAGMEWPVSERFALTLRGENLLDEQTVDVLGFNAPGAAVMVGFKLK